MQGNIPSLQKRHQITSSIRYELSLTLLEKGEIPALQIVSRSQCFQSLYQ